MVREKQRDEREKQAEEREKLLERTLRMQTEQLEYLTKTVEDLKEALHQQTVDPDVYTARRRAPSEDSAGYHSLRLGEPTAFLGEIQPTLRSSHSHSPLPIRSPRSPPTSDAHLLFHSSQHSPESGARSSTSMPTLPVMENARPLAIAAV